MFKKLSLSILLAIFVLSASFGFADAYVRVRGYYRNDGTYVSPHVRSNPNSLRYDNYSYRGGNLYNPSYYSSSRNYSSSWYTPSYLTDTDYYRGKSYYNSGYYSSSYLSPYSYSSGRYYSSYSPYSSYRSYRWGWEY